VCLASALCIGLLIKHYKIYWLHEAGATLLLGRAATPGRQILVTWTSFEPCFGFIVTPGVSDWLHVLAVITGVLTA
jgi:hypothetical protein